MRVATDIASEPGGPLPAEPVNERITEDRHALARR